MPDEDEVFDEVFMGDRSLRTTWTGSWRYCSRWSRRSH